MTHDQLKLLDEILSIPRFREWCLGDAPEMDDFFLSWPGSDPARAEILDYAKEMTRSFRGELLPVSDAYISEKVNLAISEGSRIEKDSRPSARSRVLIPLQVAASVLLILALGWGIYLYDGIQNSDLANKVNFHSPSHKPETRVITIRNTGNYLRHAHLPDGSSVILQPSSEISFPTTFSSLKREVHLSGEAFFEVVKNKQVPFYVLANDAVTKVVGTSFRIKAKPGIPGLEVNVKSGTVMVFRDKVKEDDDVIAYHSERAMILNKNEKAIFKFSGTELLPQPEPIDTQARLPIEKIGFVYESTPLPDVFADLETAYGVTINYNSDQLASCSLTAELSDEPLYTKIKWIAAILEADYTITDNEIIINGKPCQ